MGIVQCFNHRARSLEDSAVIACAWCRSQHARSLTMCQQQEGEQHPNAGSVLTVTENRGKL